MTSIGASAFSMGYYGDGSRMWKKTSPSSNPTFYLYGGSTIPECEFDSSGHVTTFHTSGPNGLLSSSAPSSGGWDSTYYAFDFRGNCANLLDNLGNCYASTSCKAYNGRNSDHTYSAAFEGFGAQVGYY